MCVCVCALVWFHFCEYCACAHIVIIITIFRYGSKLIVYLFIQQLYFIILKSNVRCYSCLYAFLCDGSRIYIDWFCNVLDLHHLCFKFDAKQRSWTDQSRIIVGNEREQCPRAPRFLGKIAEIEWLKRKVSREEIGKYGPVLFRPRGFIRV